MKFDPQDKVVKAPDGLKNSLYHLTKAVVRAAKMKQSLVGTKEEVLAKAAKMNGKNRHFEMKSIMVTFSLTVLMCAGLFLLLWGAVGFVQDKRFFSSAPKEIQEAAQPKPERFAGQHVLGWCMLILALAMMLGAVVLGVWHGIRSGFTFAQFFIRFLIMFLGMKAFDILVFDWFLLCHSGFFPHYYPEVRQIVGPHLFGYNLKSHLAEITAYVIASVLIALLCTVIF